ncbi:MAG: LCP family protein [Anaerolineae bacterium]
MRGSPLAILALVIVAMLVMAGASFAAYTGVRQFVIDSPVDLPTPPQFNAPERPTPTVEPTQATADGGVSGTDIAVTATPLTVGTTSAIPVLTDPRRITILLLGVDQRPGEKGPFRSDTIMVLSFDPVRKAAAMLSIPRDVYVTIPGYRSDTINTANFTGDLDNYPGGGGPALAMRTVQALIGVPIDRYVLINFQAFNTVIDALGTVEVCPTERIFDDQYPETDGYGVITVEFQPGCQELDTTRLLQYARVRHNAGDDFGRAQRQQEVIKAVQKKVLSLGGVSALLGKAGDIWTSLHDNIRTNLTYEEIMSIANAAQGVTVKSAVLTVRTDKGGQLIPSTLDSGRQVFTPVYEDVYRLVVQLFDAGQAVPENAQAQSEGAVIAVMNGTGIEGLAKRTADSLTAQGFVVGSVGNAEALGSYNKSEIRVYTGKMNTARYLAQILKLEGTVIVQAQDGPPGIDIALIIGSDLAPAQ